MKPRGSVAFFIPHLGCPHDCSFCNQRHIASQSEAPTPEEVARTLQSVLESRRGQVGELQIAFFGGSFTAIEPGLRHGLLDAAAPFCNPNGFAGIRFSTRPDAITPEVLAELSPYPITDIELGVQSMRPSVLEQNHRGHTVQDVHRAMALLRQRPYRVTLQLMTGLPGDDDEGARDTARQIADMKPDGVRIYPAIVLRDTLLADWLAQGCYQPPTLDESVALCAELLLLFTERGIPVLRVGLQHSEGIEQSYLAGPYHPAFRELCEGEALIRQVLEQRASLSPGAIRLTVAPAHQSALTGHGRRALRPLEEAGYHPFVITDPALSYLQIKASKY